MKYSKIALAIATVLLTNMSNASEVKTKGIDVTATRVQRDLLEVPVSVSVVDEKEISKKAVSTIGDLLEDVPGVSVNNDGSQGLKRIGIRGENAYRTLILIDGQRITEQKSMSGTPMLIDPASVERIEVIKGPNSVLYGSDAIGGVVNIITKKNSKDKFSANVSSGYDGSGNAYRESGSVSGKVEGLGYRFGAANSESGNLRVPHETVKNTGFRQKAFDGLLSYDFTDKITAGIKGDYFDSNINSSTDDLSNYDEFYVKIPVWKRSKVNIFADMHDLSEKLVHLRLDAYTQRNQKIMTNHFKMTDVKNEVSHQVTGPLTVHMETSTKSQVGMDIDAKNNIITNGVTLQSEWQLGQRNYLTAGAGFENDSFTSVTNTKGNLNLSVNGTGYRYNSTSGATNPMNVNVNRNIDMANSVTTLSGGQRTVYGYLSDEIELTDALNANLGARYTKVDTNCDLNSKYDALNNNVSFADTGDSTNNRTVFNAGLVYSITDDTTARFSFGQGFRAPILQERYFTTSMGGGTVKGNENLKAETSNSYELGIRHSSKGFFADAAVFLTKSKNYISTKDVNEGDDTIQQYFNVASAKTFGAEVTVSYELFDRVTPYTSVTYMRRRFDENSPILKSTYDSDTPSLMARAGVRYEHEFSLFTLTTDAYARGQSKRDYTYVSKENVAHSHHGGFTTANFEICAIFGENRQYQISAGWLNILNKRYYTTDAIAEPGSHGFVTMQAKF
ncbi:TonB-dependent receptor plug domain-containing protein [Succinivibrio faecicola]|uniref:TonB-dependent receptor n=1 Tax=Succinivibrio faecicola TaxID=2820300 RepID=A0ABS7DGW7_9GAMM|nr:TonB-dependent receptor [Succinivibrio faecicola]MBW7570362.1 TonB-dependent receptor [Succinivibrio faecicola]